MKRIFSFVLIMSGILLAADKLPFTIQTLYDLKNVSDPQISPDGRQIAFVLSSTDLAEGTSHSEIWLMDADGSNQRQLTRSEASDYHPRWSADGKFLLFISTRENGTQAWKIPVDGGEAERVTDFSTGVSGAEWLGATNKIIFTSKVFPECGADQECNDRINAGLSDGPLHAHMADRLFYRHWTFYKDGRRTHTFLFNPVNGEYKDLTPGDFDSPGLWGTFSVSPDGKYLCVESNRDQYEAETTNTDLYLVEIATGKTTNLTDENEAYDGQPVFSPDSRYIAYQKQLVPTFEADLKRLAVYDLQTGEHKILTAGLDAWTQNYVWTPDSKDVLFIYHEKGHFPISKVDIKSKKITPVTDVKTADAFDIDPNSKWLVIARRSIAEPSALVRCNVKDDRDGKKINTLTTFNRALTDSVDIRPAEEMWIPSPSGKKIHTYVIKPHNFDPAKKYPLILNVHGGPQYQWADAFRGDWQVYPGSGYIVAFPNPHGSTGYGQEFTNAISKDWGGKVYEDVMAVADSLGKLSYVDEDRMGAMGWSYGGYMMMWLEGHTSKFKAIVSMMGVYNLTAMYGSTEELWFPHWDLGGTPWENPELYKKWSPNEYVENFKTPCLVITGEKDYRVPYTQSLEFFTGLQKMRVPSRLIVFPDDGHWPDYVKSMPFYYNAHLDWFHKYLGGDPALYDMIRMQRNEAFK